jgi:integrase
MARASKFTRDLMRALQDTGHATVTGPSIAEVLMVADKADGTTGRTKTAKSRPYVKKRKDGNPVVYARTPKGRKSLRVLLEGMSVQQAEIATQQRLIDLDERRLSEYLEEKSPEDLTLKEIYDRWVANHRAMWSPATAQQKERNGRHLFGHRPALRYGDLEDTFGFEYVKHRVAGLKPGKKMDSATQYAISHLDDFENALEEYLTYATVDKVRRFKKPESKRKSYPFYITWDWLLRLILIARGWDWDKENDCWRKRWDEESGRWVLCYDRSRRDDALVRYIMIYVFSGTRDSTIPALRWGTNLEGGTIDPAGGIIVRRPPGHERTKKRAEPAHLIGPLRRLVKHWEADDILLLTPNVIHLPGGGRIDDMRGRFDKVADDAGLPWVTPHYCKHTGATLYAYAGVDRYELADAFCTLHTTLYRDYVHLRFLFDRPGRRCEDPRALTLLRLRHVMPPSTDEWLKDARRLKEEYEAKKAEAAAERLSPTSDSSVKQE